MPPAQMALPVDRRNGASAHRPVPTAPAPGPVPAPVLAAEAPRAPLPVGVTAVPVWVRQVTTVAVLAVALVAAWPPVGLLLSYELLLQQIRARGGPGVHTVRSGASNPSDGGDR
jgi:hypothetical protein